MIPTSRISKSNEEPHRALLNEVRSVSSPLFGWEDLDPLMQRIGDARYVLLGEATHGTAEFYDWRRMISQRLIREKGFSFIAVEGDWPDCYRVNRYVKGQPAAGDNARDVLHCFERWPTWMWANEEVAVLAEWLRDHNRRLPAEQKVSFYGLDVYSLWDSMHQVLRYVEREDGAAAAATRRAFECFEPYGYDVNDYTGALAWVSSTCEDAVVEMLRKLREQAPPDNGDGSERFFNAEQNALVAKNAEKYYRAMLRGDSSSWNVRDRQMMETLDRLMELHGPDAKAIVWAHNTHLGDARYTDMAAAGEVNMGQLVRQSHAGDGVVIVGFATHHGTVIAGSDWDGPTRSMPVPAAGPGSWEDVLHRTEPRDQLLTFDRAESSSLLLEPRGHRAIGVVYRPQYEAHGNYVPTVLPRRYDALAYFDETHALHPLHVDPSLEHEVPETFPSGV